MVAKSPGSDFKFWSAHLIPVTGYTYLLWASCGQLWDLPLRFLGVKERPLAHTGMESAQ